MGGVVGRGGRLLLLLLVFKPRFSCQMLQFEVAWEHGFGVHYCKSHHGSIYTAALENNLGSDLFFCAYISLNYDVGGSEFRFWGLGFRV